MGAFTCLLIILPFLTLGAGKLILSCISYFILFKFPLSLNFFSHYPTIPRRGHTCSESASWQIASLLSESFYLPSTHHSFHNPSQSFVTELLSCVLLVFKPPLSANALPHLEQANSFSPLCILVCILKQSDLVKFLLAFQAAKGRDILDIKKLDADLGKEATAAEISKAVAEGKVKVLDD